MSHFAGEDSIIPARKVRKPLSLRFIKCFQGTYRAIFCQNIMLLFQMNGLIYLQITIRYWIHLLWLCYWLKRHITDFYAHLLAYTQRWKIFCLYYKIFVCMESTRVFFGQIIWNEMSLLVSVSIYMQVIFSKYVVWGYRELLSFGVMIFKELFHTNTKCRYNT